jgi:hypothetical protein
MPTRHRRSQTWFADHEHSAQDHVGRSVASPTAHLCGVSSSTIISTVAARGRLERFEPATDHRIPSYMHLDTTTGSRAPIMFCIFRINKRRWETVIRSQVPNWRTSCYGKTKRKRRLERVTTLPPSTVDVLPAAMRWRIYMWRCGVSEVAMGGDPGGRDPAGPRKFLNDQILVIHMWYVHPLIHFRSLGTSIYRAPFSRF